MLKTIRNRIKDLINGKLACGLEYDIISQTEIQINFVLVREEKGKLKIVKTGSGISDLAEVKKLIPSGIPVYLSLNGKGIIHRHLDGESKDPSALLQQVLPNAKPEEFYIQNEEADSGNFISIVRKQTMTEILELFNSNGLELVNCTLGPFCLRSVLPLLDLDPSLNSALFVRRHQLHVQGGRIEEHVLVNEFHEQEHRMGDDVISSSSLISFAAAMDHFGLGAISFTMESILVKREDLFQKRKLKIYATVAVSALFILLLSNYFLFTHYSDKFSYLNEKNALNENILRQYDTLQKQVEQKKQFLEGKGLLEPSHTSWYSDQLSQDLPKGILLDRMNINPLKKENVNDESEIAFEHQQISVSGKCSRSNLLNTWINELKSKKWIKEVKLVHFSQDKITEEGIFLISIHIS